MKLTENMQKALKEARHPQGIRRVHDLTKPGKPKWPHPPATIRALERHGFVERTQMVNRRAMKVDVWKITETGEMALNPPRTVRGDSPKLMHRAYTTMRLHLVADVWEEIRVPEPELMEYAPPAWVQRGKVKHADDQNRKERARRLRAA